MKTLELNQMENVQGSWNWKTCAAGAVSLTYAYGNSGAVFLGGWIGAGAAAIAGCAIGGVGGS